MTKLLLDNCVVNNLVESEEVFAILSELVELGNCKVFVCYSVIEEFSKIPDSEKRAKALMRLFSLLPQTVYDSAGVVGYSRVGTCFPSDGEIYEQILKESRNNVRDAIIAETAVRDGMVLVTSDNDLYKLMKSHGYNVVKPLELQNQNLQMDFVYPILKQEYKCGLVCYFDILGFGNFSSKAENIQLIRNLITNLQGAIRIHKLGNLIGDITFFSDCVFFTTSLEELKEPMFITSVIDFVCLARDIIQHHIGTDIRAGIAYGEYIHLDSGEIYGPAVVQAVKLADHKKESDPLFQYLPDDPAAIILHANLLSMPLNEYGEVTRILSDKKRYRPIGNTSFFLVNPYYFIYDTKRYGGMLSGNVRTKKELCDKWERQIMKNEGHLEKYNLSLEFLHEFENDNEVQ